MAYLLLLSFVLAAMALGFLINAIVKFIRGIIQPQQNRKYFITGATNLLCSGVFALLWHSIFYVDSDEVVLAEHRWHQKTPPPSRNIAFHDESGWQARIIPPGWHCGNMPIFYNIERHPPFKVPPHNVGVVIAKEGGFSSQRLVQTSPDREIAFDAQEFLKRTNALRGVQPFVLDAGNNRLNPKVFEVIPIPIDNLTFYFGVNETRRGAERLGGEITASTRDDAEVSLDLSITVFIEKTNAPLFFSHIRSADPLHEEAKQVGPYSGLIAQVEGLVRDRARTVPPEYDAIDVQKKRDEIRDKLKQILHTAFAEIGVTVQSVDLREIKPTPGTSRYEEIIELAHRRLMATNQQELATSIFKNRMVALSNSVELMKVWRSAGISEKESESPVFQLWKKDEDLANEQATLLRTAASVGADAAVKLQWARTLAERNLPAIPLVVGSTDIFPFDNIVGFPRTNAPKAASLPISTDRTSFPK